MKKTMENDLWWREGVVYQIYPRSFSDSNADGLGDLPGILSRLDYLASLGIDAIWLSPFYPSPDKDFGYDISDYCNVDPRMGTLADFERLVSECHRRGIRVIVDMVMNHTSDQHAWFRQSRSSRDNPKRDWYIWRQKPNNWQACFGGNAWEFDPVTGEYYLHLFTPEQPDVNWRNPSVLEAQLEVFRFWLERGVDGFRLDVFNAYFKSADFQDNPPRLGLRAFSRQNHIHDMDQPEMMPFLGSLRRLLDSYPGRFAVGETYLATPEKTISYCGDSKLHAAFSFDFTSYTSEISAALNIFHWTPAWIMKKIIAREKVFNAAGLWPTTVMSNHDLPRAISRYARGEDDSMGKIIMTILLTLRGTPFMYQGEEIGMRDISLHRGEILDPPGRKYWPFYYGRDGCRSPMQWDSTSHAGFSPVMPWLKVHPDYRQRNVAAQELDPGSLLNFTRSLVTLRRSRAALRQGDFLPVLATRHVLAYLRKREHETILVAMNFDRRPRSFVLPGGIQLKKNLLTSVKDPGEDVLQPREVSLWEL